MAHSTLQIRTKTLAVLVLFYFYTSTMSPKALKNYYYDYVHWLVKNSIYHVRKKNYPFEYWQQDLKESLKYRNEIAQVLAHKVCEPGSQLSFDF